MVLIKSILNNHKEYTYKGARWHHMGGGGQGGRPRPPPAPYLPLPPPCLPPPFWSGARFARAKFSSFPLPPFFPPLYLLPPPLLPPPSPSSPSSRPLFLFPPPLLPLPPPLLPPPSYPVRPLIWNISQLKHTKVNNIAEISLNMTQLQETKHTKIPGPEQYIYTPSSIHYHGNFFISSTWQAKML